MQAQYEEISGKSSCANAQSPPTSSPVRHKIDHDPEELVTFLSVLSDVCADILAVICSEDARRPKVTRDHRRLYC